MQYVHFAITPKQRKQNVKLILGNFCVPKQMLYTLLQLKRYIVSSFLAVSCAFHVVNLCLNKLYSLYDGNREKLIVSLLLN